MCRFVEFAGTNYSYMPHYDVSSANHFAAV